MKLTQRNVWIMGLLLIITCGLYQLYWIVKTKLELNQSGAHIPSAWLLIIPFVNIYFFYKFAEGFCIVVLRDEKRTVTYFLLIILLPLIGALIYQSDVNSKKQITHL